MPKAKGRSTNNKPETPTPRDLALVEDVKDILASYDPAAPPSWHEVAKRVGSARVTWAISGSEAKERVEYLLALHAQPGGLGGECSTRNGQTRAAKACSILEALPAVLPLTLMDDVGKTVAGGFGRGTCSGRVLVGRATQHLPFVRRCLWSCQPNQRE